MTAGASHEPVEVVIAVSRDWSWAYGSGRVIYPAIRAARISRKYDEARRAIRVRTGDVDSLVAALELQFGADVQVKQVAI